MVWARERDIWSVMFVVPLVRLDVCRDVGAFCFVLLDAAQLL